MGEKTKLSDWINFLNNKVVISNSIMTSNLSTGFLLLTLTIAILSLSFSSMSVVIDLLTLGIDKTGDNITFWISILSIITVGAGLLFIIFSLSILFNSKSEYNRAKGLLNYIMENENEIEINAVRKMWKEKKTFRGFKMSNRFKWIGIIIALIISVVIFFFLKDYISSINLDEGNLFFYVAIPIILAILAPFINDWVNYRFTTPKIDIFFKPADGKTFKERKKQEIELKPNKEQLIWVMLHNNGRVIKDHWFVNVDFEKGFGPIDIEKTSFKDVDFVKEYSIQKKYNVANFNSSDFSPLFPYDETFIFPIVVKTPKDEKEYAVRVTVRTGNHRNKLRHEMKIKIKK